MQTPGAGRGGGGWLTGFYADVKAGPVIFFVNLTCTDYQNPYPSCECKSECAADGE